MPQGIPTGRMHSCSKRIYAFALLAGARIGKTSIPNIVEWFVKMVEERKKHHDSSKEKKGW